MNKRDFITSLISELKNIEPSELQDIIQYYNEYFDEAGEENEEQVIKELGSPKTLANQIKTDSAIKYLQKSNLSAKKSFKSVWVIIGAIFAAPVALPIGIALAAVAIALAITFACLILTFFLLSASLAVLGVFIAVTSFFIIPTNFGSFLLMFGLGLIMAGLSILVFIPTLMLARVSFKWLGMFINRNILKRSDKNE